MTEGRNTGFQKIRCALHRNGSPELRFESDEERTYFMTTIYAHPDFIHEGDVLDDTLDTQQRSIDKLVKETIKENPTVMIVEMTKIAGVSRLIIERAVKRLRDTGRIVRVGGKRNGQ